MTNEEIYSVLICDDDINNRKILHRYLEQDNFLPIQAGNAHEALEILRVVVPDIILMDYQMPNLNGIDTIRLIRTVNQRSAVVLMTAYASDEVRFDALVSQADYFLSKPINYKVISSLLREKITERQQTHPIEMSYADILSGIEDHLHSILVLSQDEIMYSHGLWENQVLLGSLKDPDEKASSGILSTITNLTESSHKKQINISLGSQHLFITNVDEYRFCMLIASGFYTKIEEKQKIPLIFENLETFGLTFIENHSKGESLDSQELEVSHQQIVDNLDQIISNTVGD